MSIEKEQQELREISARIVEMEDRGESELDIAHQYMRYYEKFFMFLMIYCKLIRQEASHAVALMLDGKKDEADLYLAEKISGYTPDTFQ